MLLKHVEHLFRGVAEEEEDDEEDIDEEKV